MAESSHLPEQPSENIKRSQNVNDNYHLNVQPNTKKSHLVSIEMLNGVSNVDGKRCVSTSVKEVAVEHRLKDGRRASVGLTAISHA